MATVSQATATRNQQPTATNLPEPIACALMAAAKVADKESARDSLSDGHAYKIEVSIIGSVDGKTIDQRIDAILSVGHETTKGSSATPNVGLLIGHILSKLNQATREKIIRELPETYAANGCELPEVEAKIADATSSMLERLRAKKTITARGAVSCKYKLEDTSGSGAGSRLAVVEKPELFG